MGLHPVLFVLAAAAALAQAPNATVIATGLSAPLKLLRTAEGKLLVSETGRTANSGRISVVTKSGARTTLLDGLPSAATAEGVSGPTAMLLDGQTLFVAIGIGDALAPGPAAGTEAPNPRGPSSLLFSSILSLRLPAPPDRISEGFSLSAADLDRLGDGHSVSLASKSGEAAEVSVFADFRDYVRDANTVVRGSNPFGMAMLGDALFVADAGMNAVWRVDRQTGRARILARIPPFRSPLPGPPVSDAVPTSIRVWNGGLLVTCLPGFPFAAGEGRVLAVSAETGAIQPFLNGLSGAMDIVQRFTASGSPQFFTVEFSGDMAARPALPGRVQQYDTAEGRIIAPVLITPTSAEVDPLSGEVFVTEMGPGRITMVRAR